MSKEFKQPAERYQWRNIVTWPVIAASVVVASCLTLGTLVTLLFSGMGRSPGSVPTVVFTRISGATMQTQSPSPNSATATPSEMVPAGGGEAIAVGVYVQIVGTGGDGLRLRDQPGLGGKVLLLGSEWEVFRVEDGPRDADGYTWWYLVGPFDETRRGWAVANYLQVIDQ